MTALLCHIWVCGWDSDVAQLSIKKLTLLWQLIVHRKAHHQLSSFPWIFWMHEKWEEGDDVTTWSYRGLWGRRNEMWLRFQWKIIIHGWLENNQWLTLIGQNLTKKFIFEKKKWICDRFVIIIPSCDGSRIIETNSGDIWESMISNE